MKNVLLAVVFAVAVAVAAIYYTKYQDTVKLLNNPKEAAKIEVNNLKSQVGQLMTIPKDEQPTIATVADVAKLKNQPFFAKAQNGDKVLIFIKAKKAILYRPSTNKIIEVSPILINSQNKQSDSKTPSVTPTKAPKPTAEVQK